MKTKLILTAFLILSLSSCMKHDFDNSATMNDKIKENVEKVFGTTFDETHDWCSTIRGNVTVPIVDNGVEKVQIIAYLKNEQDTTNTIVVLNEEEVNGRNSVTLYYDIPNIAEAVYSAQISKTGITYSKISGTASVRTRAASTSYNLPSAELKIAGSIESYASKRGWIPGEQLYYMSDYSSQQMSVSDYDDDFKEIFRNIIFSYFKNGRKYNNLPLVQQSGFYNSSCYPITTGKDPIIISPVYKNDGGYQEVVNSDLYYYYFKESDVTGDPVAYFESLPKYKALAFSNCICGDDEICKHASYALIYWGDGIPTEGTTGTYQFPEGYSIGFMVRAMTTAEGGKKQGELYGDGRLNNYINFYDKCNFKSSKLGTDGPRIAWMNVNGRMLICYESGTDTDFNDIIIEVEGGIEPFVPYIVIDENFYTFCFEDTPFGDYDLNDVVIKGKRLNSTQVEYRLIACGAYDELYIGGINGNKINDKKEVHSLFGAEIDYINTTAGKVYDPIVETITVNKNFSFLDEATQPYVIDVTNSSTIKIARTGEDPHAIMIPYDFKYPLEKVCIKDAYERFNSWGENKVESTDWYKFPKKAKVY